MKKFDKFIERLSEKDCKCVGSCDGFLRKLYDDDNFYCISNCFDCLKKTMLYLNEEYKKPPVKLTRLEYELIKFWKENGFDKLTKRSSDGRMYIHNVNTKNIYELKQKVFDGLFKYKNEFIFDEILNNYEIIDE